MRNIFLETSAVNRAVATGVDAKALRDHLTQSDRCPVIGIHAIYELAATFLRPERADTGKALFRFVRDLDPSFTPPTMDLLLRRCSGFAQTPPCFPF